jgi:hypothetical protein
MPQRPYTDEQGLWISRGQRRVGYQGSTAGVWVDEMDEMDGMDGMNE